MIKLVSCVIAGQVVDFVELVGKDRYRKSNQFLKWVQDLRIWLNY